MKLKEIFFGLPFYLSLVITEKIDYWLDRRKIYNIHVPEPETRTPAQIVRDGWLGLIWKTTPEDVDKLQQNFLETKMKIVGLREQNIQFGVHDDKSEAYRPGLYVLAFALLPYGKLEVVDDILENYPYGGVKRRWLIEITKFLFPVPDEFAVLRHYEYKNAFERWFIHNRDQLEWSEVLGKYLLKETK